jgi:hypothetical protein
MPGRSQHDHCKTTHSLSKRGSLLDAARPLGHQLSVAWSFPSLQRCHGPNSGTSLLSIWQGLWSTLGSLL